MLKVLVVEDEIIIAIDLESHLERSGNECVGIADNLDKTTDLMTNDVKLVFMDINLNGRSNGFEVAEILRKKFNFYLVFISASNKIAMTKKIEIFNHSEFIKKPFSYKNILQAIENAKKLY